MRFLLLLTGLLNLMTPAQAATVTFTASGTVTALSGSSSTVNARVTISTLQDMVQVQIMNNIVGASRDLQAVSAVDFVLSTGQVSATLSSQAGLVRTIASNGTWTAGDTVGGRGADFSSGYNGEWVILNSANQTSGLNGGITLTAFNGGNPNLTIMGAPNANNLYNSFGNPNPAVTGHNPYLATAGQPVTFTMLVSGVTVGTTILPGNLRMFFGTDRSAYLDAVIMTPEPAGFALTGMGLVGLSLLSGRMRRRAHRQGER